MIKENLKKFIFPFTAIIGQDEMKLALILNIIDPKIGGLLVMGDRGTGKSTTIRAIVDLLPKIEVIKDNPFNLNNFDKNLITTTIKKDFKYNKTIKTEFIKIPMINLPLGVTEESVCGTINIEKILTKGIKSFEPGLLAKANRGFLYVDEINLLEDHIVDILLDSAASGWNTVEREGISISHPAQFILVGSGNPEEGELRPQLLDRFGMYSEIHTIKDPILRVKIVEERLSYEQNPLFWIQNYEFQQQKLRNQILEAQKLLSKVEINYDLKIKISKICSILNIDGLRGDIVINRAAKAYAAYNKRLKVESLDILKIITLCLSHRLKKNPLDSINSNNKINKIFQTIFELKKN